MTSMSLVEIVGAWNLSILGMFGSFLFVYAIGKWGDFQPSKKEPHWIAKYNRDKWLKASLMPLVLLLIFLLATLL